MSDARAAVMRWRSMADVHAERPMMSAGNAAPGAPDGAAGNKKDCDREQERLARTPGRLTMWKRAMWTTGDGRRVGGDVVCQLSLCVEKGIRKKQKPWRRDEGCGGLRLW